MLNGAVSAPVRAAPGVSRMSPAVFGARFISVLSVKFPRFDGQGKRRTPRKEHAPIYRKYEKGHPSESRIPSARQRSARSARRMSIDCRWCERMPQAQGFVVRVPLTKRKKTLGVGRLHKEQHNVLNRKCERKPEGWNTENSKKQTGPKSSRALCVAHHETEY